jgi:hypothetical protein
MKMHEYLTEILVSSKNIEDECKEVGEYFSCDNALLQISMHSRVTGHGHRGACTQSEYPMKHGARILVII